MGKSRFEVIDNKSGKRVPIRSFLESLTELLQSKKEEQAKWPRPLTPAFFDRMIVKNHKEREN